MFGFNVENGVAYKVELPSDDETTVLTEDCNESGCTNTSSLQSSASSAKSTLSSMLMCIGNEVTQAYAKIHQKKNPYDPIDPVIDVYDVYSMMDKYRDYYKAMVEYVKLVCDVKDGEVDLDKATEKVNRALSNDPGFIHSIVDKDKMDLERTMKQFECVVELIHEIDDRANQITQIFSHAPQTNLRNMAERLICGSVCKFNDDMITFVNSNIRSLKQLLDGTATRASIEVQKPASNAYIML